MLRELYDANSRFSQEDPRLYYFYRYKKAKWVIEIDEKIFHITGPFENDSFRRLAAPDRQRSSKSSKAKPFLGIEKAKYAFLLPTKDVPPPFWRLMKDASEETKDSGLVSIVAFYESKGFRSLLDFKKKSIRGRKKIDDDDLVAFRVSGESDFPFEREQVADFWYRRLSNESLLVYEAICSISGEKRSPLKLIPQEIVVMGQKCQISSFNKSAFTSFGKGQTANASISVEAIAKAIQSLQYLANHPRHHAVLARGDTKSRTDPLRNYFAIFWLQREETNEIDGEKFNSV